MADTVKEILETITSAEELAGFSETLRSPPHGAVVRRVTKEEWQMIAMKKIWFMKNENERSAGH